ncbi:unnamed protein product [Cuscuta campestris]|uniref:CCHC-type domain-containing protein n=1 Tax=Cuscuta campestris TaxID=132261 RepID=A0A484MZC7_9ASTE|nr:unnamed protein product [Cuscuta campestris]
MSSDWRRCNSTAREDAGSGGDVQRSAWRRCNSTAMSSNWRRCNSTAREDAGSGGDVQRSAWRRCNPTALDDRRGQCRRRTATRREIGEGQSTSRHPLFDGTNYTYWKERMRIYIRSTKFQLWLVIKNGEETSMKKVDEKLIPKTEDEFDAEDIKKVENCAKAINMLYCAVNPDDYRKISCCTTTKEMWDKLEVTYEGTDQVQEAKIDFLTQEYEMFRMKEHEKIDDMFDRFSKIVNDVHALKKTYTDRDLVRKILRSLTSEWRSNADAIYESIGTSNVTIHGLRGNLKTYESTILNPSLNDQRKGIALKAVKESTMDDSSDDDEVKLVMKKFCKLLRKKEKVEDGPVCYGCGEAGHIKNKCPKSGRNARHFKRQRAALKAQVEYLAKEVTKLTKIKLNALQGSDHEDDSSTSGITKARAPVHEGISKESKGKKNTEIYTGSPPRG